MMGWDEASEPLGEAETRSLGAAGKRIGATEREGTGANTNVPCSFCTLQAVTWLIPVGLDFGPDEGLPALCEACADVVSVTIKRFPKDTDRWGWVHLEWPPITDEAEAIRSVEDMLGLGPSDELTN